MRIAGGVSSLDSLRLRKNLKAHGFALWVVDSGVLTGQSIVTERVDLMLKRFHAQRHVLTAGLAPGALVHWIGAIIRLSISVLRGRIHTVYIVCSRSWPGFLRDVPAYLSRFAGVRVVVHAHGSDVIEMLQRPLARSLLRGCELIVPSPHLRAPLSNIGFVACHVCENFVDQRIESQPSRTLSPFTVLWNSNVMASKGFFVVAEAVRLLHARGMDIRLVALGVPIGDEVLAKEACAAKLATLAGAPWLSLRGPLSHEAARAVLWEADLVCLPSRYKSECQPLSLLEAMCAGRPLVIADTAALRATVGDYPSIVVERVDVPAMVAAIERSILETRSGAVDLRGHAESARKRFSADRFDEQMGLLLGLPRTS